jgi:hypothetical protein
LCLDAGAQAQQGQAQGDQVASACDAVHGDVLSLQVLRVSLNMMPVAWPRALSRGAHVKGLFGSVRLAKPVFAPCPARFWAGCP